MRNWWRNSRQIPRRTTREMDNQNDDQLSILFFTKHDKVITDMKNWTWQTNCQTVLQSIIRVPSLVFFSWKRREFYRLSSRLWKTQNTFCVNGNDQRPFLLFTLTVNSDLKERKRLIINPETSFRRTSMPFYLDDVKERQWDILIHVTMLYLL